MTIKRDGFIGHLKKPIIAMVQVYVRMPRGVEMSVQSESCYIVHGLLRDNPDKRGVPELACIENGRMVSVFPRADKRYRLRVIGTQYVEQ